jgi:dethiobiotin synthetase/adenosylmethionine--8-amino-7-oxononanoate aminotransferase
MYSLFSLVVLHRRHHHQQLLLRHIKHLSSTTPHLQLHLPLNHPTFLIWASNTSLGKTLVSTGLAASSLLSANPISKPRKFLYLKPIQTGYPSDSDSSFVFRKLSRLSLRRHPHFPLFSSNHVLKASVPSAQLVPGQEIAESCDSGMRDLGYYEETRTEGEVRMGSGAVSELVCKTLYAWREAVSPHLAAERESGVLEDSAVLELLQKCLRAELEGERKEMDVFCVVETAGGVASPGPSGSLQCDLYRYLILITCPNISYL